jgi:hypothetical protein
MAKCEVCNKSPMETALFRINETGVDGIFRCKAHYPRNQSIDPVVEDIVNIICLKKKPNKD